MTNITLPDAVPSTIVRAMGQLLRRMRLAIMVRGLCATGAAALCSLLAIMGIDASVTIFAAWPRWALSVAALAVAGASAWFFLVRPLARSLGLTGVARMLEARHPEMHERISSALQLLASHDAPELRGSDALISALAGQASVQAAGVQPRREVTLCSARPYVLAAAGSVLLLAAMLALWPHRAVTLLARALAPGANLPNVYDSDLQIAPGDAVLADGDSLQIHVTVRNSAVRQAQLLRAAGTFSETHLPMSLEPSQDGLRHFMLVLAPLKESFRYRIHAGDALSRYYSVTVVRPPSLERMTVQYEYPAYAARKAQAQPCQGPLKAMAGSVARVTIQADGAIERATVRIQDKAERFIPGALWPDRLGASFQVPMPLGLSGKWSVVLTGPGGFARSTAAWPIEALADEPPKARIVHPDGPPLRLRRNDQIPIDYVLSDDVGLGGARLLLKADTGALDPIPIAQTTGQDAAPRRLAAGRTTLDLAALRLDLAHTLTLWVAADDNLPSDMGGPHTAMSNPVTIELDAAAKDYAQQVQIANELRIRQVLEQVLKALQNAKEDSGPLAKAMPKLQSLNDSAIERIDRLGRNLAAAQGQLPALVGQITQSNYSPLCQRLADLNDNLIAKAASMVGQIKLCDTPQQRADAADEADLQVERAITVVSDILKNLGAMTEQARKAQALTQLAQRQQELAEQRFAMDSFAEGSASTEPATMSASAPSQGSKGPSQALQASEWKQRQAALAGQVDQLVRERPRALGARSSAEQEKAKDLVAEARELSRQQAALSHECTQAAQLQALDAELQKLAQAPQDQPQTKQQTSASLARREPIAKALQQEQCARLGAQEAQLLQQMMALSDRVRAQWPMADRLDTAAIRSAMATSQKLQAGSVAGASDSAIQAANSFAELAIRLRTFQRRTPETTDSEARKAEKGAESRPVAVEGSTQQEPRQVQARLADHKARQMEPLAADAAEMSLRQKHLTGQIQAMERQTPRQVIALAQECLSARTDDLAKDIDLLHQFSVDLIPEPAIRARADHALTEVGKAQASQKEAAKLIEGSPAVAAGHQQASSASLENVAKALEELAGQLTTAAAAALAKPPEDKDLDEQDAFLAQADQEADKAARTEQATDAERAAMLLKALAQRSVNRALRMGILPTGTMADAVQGLSTVRSSISLTGSGLQSVELTAQQLRDLGISPSDWAALPGQLRDEVLQAAAQTGPQEYRDLIKQYFQELSRRGQDSVGQEHK